MFKLYNSIINNIIIDECFVLSGVKHLSIVSFEVGLYKFAVMIQVMSIVFISKQQHYIQDNQWLQ